MSVDNEIYDYLLRRCEKYLSLRPRSEHEVSQYVVRKLQKIISQNEIKEKKEQYVSKILAHYRESGALNDPEFVKWWVEQRQYFKPRGKRVLVSELMQKGVSPSDIQSFFDDIQIDEALGIQTYLRKISVNQLQDKENREKIIRKLLRRGFGYFHIKKAIEESLGKEYN